MRLDFIRTREAQAGSALRARRPLRLTLILLAAAAIPTLQARAAPSAYPSAEAVLAHPEATNPFNYAIAVRWLWEHDRRQQAAFWFYVFQARTRPWALADKRGDAAGALRGALNEELGTTINRWIGSDLGAWRNTAERAVSYERRLPLSPERPDGVDAATWQRLVATSRADYAAQMRTAFAGLSAQTLAAKRAENGLHVGPLDRPGPPLPDAWR